MTDDEMKRRVAELAPKFAEGFYGYGSWSNTIRFGGLEERGCGGPGGLKEAYCRLIAWERRGRRDLEHLFPYQADFLGSPLKLPNPNTLLTWRCLAKLTASLNILGTDWRAILNSQFGNPSGGVTLFELQPLPCPGAKPSQWPWINWLNPPTSREEFERKRLSPRIAVLGERLSEHPGICVAYGNSKSPYWEELADTAARKLISLQVGKLPEILPPAATSLFLLPHPQGCHGIADAFFAQVGTLISKSLQPLLV